MSSSALPIARTPRRRLILRDGLIFLSLCGITIALFLVTLLLFRSFEDHREELGKRWASRGQVDLQRHRPEAAVGDLRTALTYQDSLPVQLMLAEALDSAGHTEEALNYYLTLREGRPGDGFINLQLARLTRKEGDAQQATDYYRASIFGDWQGDGAQRRREVRFELTDYLAQRGDTAGAHDELLVAAGNTPETAETDTVFGDRLAALNDQAEALTFYNKALAENPRQRQTMAKAGRLAFDLGQYDSAYKLLTSAASEHGGDVSAEEVRQWTELAAAAHRIPELSLSRELPASQRADHLLTAAHIAQQRLASCIVEMPFAVQPAAAVVPKPTPPPALQGLVARWTAAAPELKKRALERDAALADNFMQLIDETEVQTQGVCGAPKGDDALLLRLASSRNSPQ